LSYNKIGFDLDVDPDRINRAVRSLVDKGLVGIIKRGAGAQSRICHVLASEAGSRAVDRRDRRREGCHTAGQAAGDDDIPPF
jgi:predicted transcriptional regulator